jgi:hypothetical protein
MATPQGPARDEGAMGPEGPDHPEDLALARPIQLLLAIGIDGHGPLTSAFELAAATRTASRNTEEAVAQVARTTIIRGSAAGFGTGFAGFSAMSVALPVNVVGFYVQAARMVSAIAILRGHDVGQTQVRKAVLDTLVGTQTDSLLVKAVSTTRGGALPRKLLGLLPSGARLVAYKMIGFRLLRALVRLLFGHTGRGVPLIGGSIVAFTDGWMMGRIAEQAKIDFPAVGTPATGL